tara:strand:+ start:266 stop:514 length:249 start_codon:yes stop_codon:yes gene_type:complete
MNYTLYIKPTCPYSIKAKQLLKQNNEKVVIYNVDKYGGIDNVYNQLESKGFLHNIKRRTVPIVFEDGKYIGGFSELKIYYNQ